MLENLSHSRKVKDSKGRVKGIQVKIAGKAPLTTGIGM